MHTTNLMAFAALAGSCFALPPPNPHIWQLSKDYPGCNQENAYDHQVLVSRYAATADEPGCENMDLGGTYLGSTTIKQNKCFNMQQIPGTEGKEATKIHLNYPKHPPIQSSVWTMTYCELTTYDQEDCNGKATAYLTCLDADNNVCQSSTGDARSAMVVCAQTQKDLFEKGGTPWKDNGTNYSWIGTEQATVNKHFLHDKVYAECVRRDCVKGKGYDCKVLDWVQGHHGCTKNFPDPDQENWREQEWY